MALVFNFQVMERQGDVVAEIKSFNSSSCGLIGNSFKPDNYKMCKDDIVAPLFCSASECISKGLGMSSEDKSVEKYLTSDEAKVNLFSPRKKYGCEDQQSMPLIERNALNYKSSSPTWNKPPMLQSFSPKKFEKLGIQETLVNGPNFLIAENDFTKTDDDNKSLPKVKSSSDLKGSNIVNDKLLLDYDAETSSSSIEEVYCSPGKEYKLENKNELLQNCETDSNCNITLKINVDEIKKEIDSVLPSLSPPKSSDSVCKDNSNSPAKSDRVMPELLPTLICLDDDDDPVVSDNKSKPCEVINVADSPEMPTLVPFTSEMEEAFRIKTELLSDDEENKDTVSQMSPDELHQPQILLQRLSVSTSDNTKENILSVSAKTARHCINGGPEIEEIEGVRFFQFRSKQDMDDFNRFRLEKAETDEDMIVPTKTTDITQIKGWRTKYFAPESQFQHLPLKVDLVKGNDSSQDNKISTQDRTETETKHEKCSSDCREVESKKRESSKCDLNESKGSSCNVSVSKKENGDQIVVNNLKEETKSSMCAFVSDKLDEYLLNSSTLNIGLLQKVNPNITPISPNASILSIGKLRKTDKRFTPLNLFKRKRDILPVEKMETDTSDSLINVTESPGSPNLIVLDSTDQSSSEDDLPVAKLMKPKKTVFRKKNLNRVLKRQSNDNELVTGLDRPSKRVVLRLTKDGDGVSKGYKVSNISCNKKSSSPSHPPTPSSPDIVHDPIEMPSDGSFPIIKQTLFSRSTEPNLLDEFINNLNMYGTRKDVAMLVQSNQSCFDEGPVLNSKNCEKAVSALVSNKLFLENKKLKKKKLKAWQKYLPKQLSNEQKMKLKRKTRTQSLCDDAGDTVSSERGKRSIRLPARYLDSAVLAASEWVSPTISIEESPSGKTYSQLLDSAEKKCFEVDEKSVSLSSSSSESENSTSSESSSDSSDDSDNKVSLHNDPQKRPCSIRKTPVKRNKIDFPSKTPPKMNTSKKGLPTAFNAKPEKKELTPVLKKSSNSKKDLNTVLNKPITSKKDLITALDKSKPLKKDPTAVLNKPATSKKPLGTAADRLKGLNDAVNKSNISKKNNISNQSNYLQPVQPATDDHLVASKENCAVFVNSKKYSLPNCSCKHCSRTAAFDNKNKFFFCNLCYATQKKPIRRKPSKVDLAVENKKKELNQIEVQVGGVFKDGSVNRLLDGNVLNVEPKADSVSKDATEDSVWTDPNIFVNYNMDLLLKLDEKNIITKCEKQSSVVKPDGTLTDSSAKNLLDESVQKKLPNPKLSPVKSLLNPANTNDSTVKPDIQIKSVNGNVKNSSISPASNGASKYILLLAPVKSVANANKPSGPVLPGSNIDKSDILNDSKKCKPPILLRKTATGFISGSAPHETANDLLPPNKNKFLPDKTVSLPLSFNSQDSTSASYKLSKLAENTVLSHQKTSLATSDNIKNQPVNIGSNFNVAYKVGDKVWFYNPPVPSTDSNSASFLNNTVTPSIVQESGSKGPIISSVQSVQSDSLEGDAEAIISGQSEVLSNGLRKTSILNDQALDSQKLSNKKCEPSSCTKKRDETSEPKKVESILNDQESCSKKKVHNRRKSPLSKIYNDDYDDCFTKTEKNIKSNPELDKELDIEVDVDTVDNSFNALSELKSAAEDTFVKVDGDSDSDMSDNEFAKIFNATADSMHSMYSKKNFKEKQRRMLIKSGFEKLKATSIHFTNANSCIEILQMAKYVIKSQEKIDLVYDLAKKRLKCHNTMLMSKLMKILNGIESPKVRKKITRQVIKDLAFDSNKTKYQKSALPLLTEGYKGITISNTIAERNISSTDAPDIETQKLKQSNITKPLTTPGSKTPVSSESLSESSSLEQSELKKLLTKPPAFGNTSSHDLVLDTAELPSECPSISNEENQPNSLLNAKQEEKSDSDTEELVSEGKCSEISDDDDDDIKICGSSKPDCQTEKSTKSSKILDSDESETNYPGLIHLFHPKVFKENFNIVDSSITKPKIGISSHKGDAKESAATSSTEIQSTPPNARFQDDDDDDDIAIIGSNSPLVPAKTLPVPLQDRCSPSNSNDELIKAAYTANKQYGPCTVQKVQLKNGQTVFAYTPDRTGSSPAKTDSSLKSPVSPNGSGARKLSDAFGASEDRASKRQKTVPEEIVLSDSEDESDDKQSSASATISSSVSPINLSTTIPKQTPESCGGQMQVDESDSDDDAMYIDESDSQNANNSCL